MLVNPILAVPAVPTTGGIKFILPTQEILLGKEFDGIAWATLALCNGINTVDAIASQLGDYDTESVTGLLKDLETLGVVVDSRQLYKRFHEVSSNPMVFASGMSDAEIIEHSLTPRSPVKNGDGTEYLLRDGLMLVKLQAARQSCRSFTGEQLSINDFGSLLDIGYSLDRHAVPSAGGLYPMKLFLLALNDQLDFSAGYYEYDNANGRLVRFNSIPDRERLSYALNDTGMPFGASAVILIAADPDRQPKKYSNRGYRFMAIEAGHIAQNISLGAIELGLATCELGGFLDEAIVDELQLGYDLPFLAIAVGRASDSPSESIHRTAHDLEVALVGPNKPVKSFWTADDAQANNHDKSYFQVLALTSNGQVTSGISTSWADAKVKAIAEAYERQRSAAVRVDVHSTASSLAKEWMDPRVATPLTDDQYQQLPHLQQFSENMEIEWVRGADRNGREVYVPIDLVFYPIHNLDRKKVVDTCSSGFATYSTYDEAVRRGLLELVERDALMRNWYSKTSPDRLDFHVLPVHLQKRIQYWRDLGRDVYVLDLSQMGVVVVEVIITSDSYPCFVSGASSSLDSFEGAAIKAFHEAESRLIHGLNEPSDRSIKPEEVHAVLDHELLYAQSREYHEYVEFLFHGKLVKTVPRASTTMAELEVSLNPIVVDVSEHDAPLRVVKVLSSEMIPISFGYGTDHYTHQTLGPGSQSAPIVPHYFA